MELNKYVTADSKNVYFASATTNYNVPSSGPITITSYDLVINPTTGIADQVECNVTNITNPRQSTTQTVNITALYI
ncbi:MAG: hypothetical protein ACRCXT_08585 [Paraclostridium sp.]